MDETGKKRMEGRVARSPVPYMAGHRFVSSTEGYRVNDLEDLQEYNGKFHPF